MVRRMIFILGITVCFFQQGLSAQPAAKSEPLTIQVLEARIKSLQDDGELSEAVKTRIVSLLNDAVARLEIAQEQLEKADRLEQRLAGVTEALQTAKNRLGELPGAVDPSITSVTDFEELNRIVETRQKQLDDPENGLRRQISDLDAEAELRRARPEELTHELAEVEQRLGEINDEFEKVSNSGESRELIQARQAFLQARKQRAQSELRALQVEADWYQSSAGADLLETQQELLAKTLALKVAELDLLQKELGQRRGSEADQRVQHAEAIAAKTGTVLRPIAEENVVLAKEQRDLANKIRDVEQRHQTTTAMLADLKKEYDRTQEMVTKVGLTDSIGLLLRQQRAKLPAPRTLRSDLAHRNEAVREIRMRLFQLEIDRASLIDLDLAAAKRADEITTVKNKKAAIARIRTLLNEKHQLSKSLEADYSKYFKQLIDMDFVEGQLLDLTTKYADYVDERVLWIRTGQTFTGDHFAKVKLSLQWISDPKLWQSVIDAAKIDVARKPLSWTVAAVLFSIWVCFGPLLAAQIRRNGRIAAETNCRDLWPTLQTMTLTFVAACGWPCLLWFLSCRLDHSTAAGPFVHSVAAGLLRVAMFLFPLELIRVCCARGGLAEHHFDWPLQSVNRTRRNMNWYMPAGAVLIGLMGLLEAMADEHRLDSLGRLAFMTFAALSAVFSRLIIRRVKTTTTTEEGLVTADADEWSDRFWRFGPYLAVMTCMGLFTLGWTGYFYSGLQLTWRLQSTIWLAVGLLMVRAVIRRWISLERRRMAILQDEELQTIAESGREPENNSHNPFLFPRWNWPDFRLNLTQIVSQMRSLLDTGLMIVTVGGLCLVWADVTPALNILDRVTLWETTVEQTVTSDDPKAGGSVQTIRRPKRVTAANVGVAALVIAIAVLAGRNIPGLVEVILLEHLAVDAGTRFAVTCLVRYAIFVAGVSSAFGQVGVGWSNVQWLVAAGSVGLGFGLQEIFCNFVSGIILLFERPMRVGDVVTIGDTTGTISRIRFRATTIVDGDRKELIVPNKEFITGKLLNWTLSDRVNRVGVKVVVTDANDPQRIQRLLLEIAAAQPNLLKDPPPTATLEEINGGMTFMLRGFLPTLDSRATAVHDLYASIHNRFQTEGIEMSCPTQEVHLRVLENNARSSKPVGSQQPQVGASIKPPMAPDFTSVFRRA